jgi:sugar O-acyltransferase (sialic acid O-acetyltransferase NeuD family)
MKNLLIIGAGGFGREVFSWASDVNKKQKTWNIKGFLDDNLSALDGFEYPKEVLSDIDTYEIDSEDEFICALGDPVTKQICIEKLLAKGAKFTNLIHPSAVVGYNVTLGVGVILCPMTIVNADAKLYNFVTLNNHSNIGHNTTVGDYTQINGYCDITGGVRIGSRVFFGSGVSVLPGIIIEDDAKIGVGSVVIRKVKANTTVFGNPAKVLN